MNLQRIAAAALACGLSLAVSAVAAQSKYPSRPIVIVVPYAAGGSTDVITRIVAQHLSNSLGSPVVVENKPGANALIGTEAVAKAANDGYTFLAASNGNSINHSLFGERGASFPRDFTPVVGLASTPNVIAVHPSIPYKSLQDLIDAAKAKPRSINYAHAGVGSLQNLVGEQFAMAAGIQLTNVPYKGGGPATVDVLAGQVPVLVSGLTASISFIKADRLRPLAVTSLKRSAYLPDVPTVAESGFPGFNNIFWVALYAPAGTPAAAIGKINSEVNKVLEKPDVLKQLAEQAADATGGSSEQLGEFVKRDIETSAKVVKAANIKVQN